MLRVFVVLVAAATLAAAYDAPIAGCFSVYDVSTSCGSAQPSFRVCGEVFSGVCTKFVARPLFCPSN